MSSEAEDPRAPHDPSTPSALSLISGILIDVEHLVEQQLQLTRREIEEEVRERLTAVAIMAAGFVSFLLAAVMLCLSLVYLLHWATSPAGTDPAQVPLWGCYAVLALVLAIIGGILARMGLNLFKSVVSSENPVTKLLQETT